MSKKRLILIFAILLMCAGALLGCFIYAIEHPKPVADETHISFNIPVSDAAAPEMAVYSIESEIE